MGLSFSSVLKVADRLTEDVTKSNYLTLVSPLGSKLEVVNERITTINSLGSRIRYFFNKSEIDKRVKEKVTDVLKGLEKICDELTDQNLFKTLLMSENEYFRRFSQNIYDRSKIPEKIIRTLKPELWNQIHRLNETYQKDRKVHYKSFFTKNEYKLRVERVKFAKDLGVEFERNKEGSSGNYKCKDYKGKTLLLFKPSSEGPVSEENPHLFIKVRNFFLGIIPFISRRACFIPDQSCIAEVVASKIDRNLKLGVVPYTSIEMFASKAFHGGSESVPQKKGSCQIWVDPKDLYQTEAVPEDVDRDLIQYFNLNSYLPLFFQKMRIKELNKKDQGVKELKSELDKWAFIHMLTGNTDGHPGNGKIVKVPFGKKEHRFIAFDFGWSMPAISHPNDYFALKFMYDFKYLPFARYEFGPKMQKKIEGLTLEKYRQLCSKISKIYTRYQTTDYRASLWQDGRTLGDNQVLFMWHRIQRLQWAVAKGKSVGECAKARTLEDFKKFYNDMRNEERFTFSPP